MTSPGVVIAGIRYVTTAEAAEHFSPDVTEEMIRDWTKRGLLRPAGRLGGRSNIYRILDVAAAEQRTHSERRGRKRQSGDLRKIDPSGQNLSTGLLAKAAQKTPTCSIFDEVGDGCALPAFPYSPFPVCEYHIVQAYTFWAELRREQAEDRRAAEEAAKPAPLPPVQVELTSYVYYLRFGDRYKIGVTTCVARRLAALPHDELLALEPGSGQLEKLRHKQFDDTRISRNREWFTLSPELQAHMKMLVDHYGEPEKVLARDGAHGSFCLNTPHARWLEAEPE